MNGIFLTIKTFLPLLKKANDASIINISSISSKIPGSSIAYSCSKATVDMLTKSLAKELSKYNIRINSVNPGIVDTGFQVNNKLLNTKEYLDFLDKMKTKYPLGIGETTDISNLVMFLVSKKAKWITGCNYIIDGGFSIFN